MDVNAIRTLANAILYEGYLLYPYRPSALKNRSQGWTFGTLVPESYAVSHAGESAQFQSEMLVTGESPSFAAELRFLHLSTGEAMERTVTMDPVPLRDLISCTVHENFAFPAANDTTTGCCPIEGTMCLSAEVVGDSVFKVRVTAANCTPLFGAYDTRDDVLRQALVSCHALATIAGGEFISLLDPPVELRAAAATCKQEGVFPVLAGLEGDRSAMLISPIILYDYPRLAANSNGDFFDSTEIDEMLTLRVMTLTEAEKDEVRAASELGRAVLQRTESLTPKEILDLHGLAHKAGNEQGS
jgi:hypothetical protein